jgi:hypothetical protein
MRDDRTEMVLKGPLPIAPTMIGAIGAIVALDLLAGNHADHAPPPQGPPPDAPPGNF